MKKISYRKYIAFIILMILILVATVFSCTRYTGKRMTEFSFQRLEEMTDELAHKFKVQINTNFNMLNTMALAFSMTDFSDTETLTTILNLYNEIGSSYMYIQLLTSDGMLLKQNGEWIDASGYIDFEQEAQKAPYLSNRSADRFSPDTLIMYETVPVIQNGETIALLYCTMSLQDMSDRYPVTNFSGNAIVMLIDGETGDMLIDTWHHSLGNMADYVKRDFKMGDTITEALTKMGNNESGNLAFTSKTTGEVLYLHYEPVGINHLSAVMGVEAAIALEDTSEIAANLYLMAAVIFIILLLITIVTVLFLLRINHNIYTLSTTDLHTGLLNRSSYETYVSAHSGDIYPESACIYVNVNGLHELNNTKGHAAGDALLLAVAHAMRKQWPDSNIYRIGGDEFLLFPPTADEAVCMTAIQGLHDTLHAQNYSVSVGFARMENEMGLTRVVKQADTNMLENKAAFYKQHNRRARE